MSIAVLRFLSTYCHCSDMVFTVTMKYDSNLLLGAAAFPLDPSLPCVGSCRNAHSTLPPGNLCSSSSHSSPHHPFTVSLSLNRRVVLRSPGRTDFRPLVRHQSSRFPFPHGLFSGAPMASANLEQKDVGSPVLNDSSKNCVCVVF